MRAWHRSLRAPFAVAMVIAAAAAFPLWRWAPLGEFYAGICVGSFLGMMFWVWDDPPHAIAKWKLGADGERRRGRVRSGHSNALVGTRSTTAAQAARILTTLWLVLVASSSSRLKNLAGRISISDRGLRASYGDAEIDGYTYDGLERGVAAAAIRVRERASRVASAIRYVPAVVVVWGEFSEIVERETVTYVAGDRLAEWLRSQPECLSARDINLIRLAVAANEIAPPAEPFAASAG